MDTSGVRKEITPYTQKLLQKGFTHVSSRKTHFQTLITSHPPNHISLLSQMKLLETPTTASLTKSDNEEPNIHK
jgi:hypothetical protein